MKKIYTLITFLFFSLGLLASELHYSINAPLYQHMVSINKEWKTQDHALGQLMQMNISFKSDEERIQMHLKLVEMVLRNRSTDHLSEEVRENRFQNLESLTCYYKRGKFPVNTKHDNRQPYFIDDYGTACAVGHLLQTSEQELLAQQIATDQNYAYIRELQYPELTTWAKENGFDASELAWIQPAYGGCYKGMAMNLIVNANPNNKINVMKVIDGRLFIGGDFEIGGIRSFASFDGTSFSGSPGMSFTGEVFDILVDDDDWIYVVGDISGPYDPYYGTGYGVMKFHYTYLGSFFLINGNTTNGIVKTGAIYNCKLYVGGDFTTIDGNNVPYLAAYSGGWTQYPDDCNGTSSSSTASLNGQVNDLEVANGRLIVGGEFTSINNNPSPGLGFYRRTGWTVPQGASAHMTSVDHIGTYTSYIGLYDELIIGADNLIGYNWQTSSFVNGGCLGELFIPYNTGRVDAVMSLSSPFKLVTYSQGAQVRAIYGDANYDEKGVGFTADNGSIVKAMVYYDGSYYAGGQFVNLSIEESLPSFGSCASYNNYNVPCPSPTGSGAMYKFEWSSGFPVELAYFEARPIEGNQAELTWQTQSENGSSHFEVERSITGEPNTFEKVKEVTAIGSPISTTNYDYIDKMPRNSNYVYYRLKIIDLDGEFDYSEVRVVKIDINSLPELTLYPNPATNEISISAILSQTGETSIKLFNLQGMLVKQINRNSTDRFLNTEIDISALADGMYLLQITTGKDQLVSKLRKL